MNIKSLKLHHYPATRSARVKWVLHEVVGDEFEVERVELYEGTQYNAEFLRLNPNHSVPVLEVTWEDGKTQYMVESAAMVCFLADAYPDKGLAPPPSDVATLNRTHSLKYVKGGLCQNESRKTENIYGRI